MMYRVSCVVFILFHLISLTVVNSFKLVPHPFGSNSYFDKILLKNGITQNGITQTQTSINKCISTFVITTLLLGFDRPVAVALDLESPSFSSHTSTSVVLADSTGKFSSKLTARKRYLPRIITGVKDLKGLLERSNVQEIKEFLDPKTGELQNLKRAMNLYGASLRKGEVPDEISRKAEVLTDKFAKEAELLGKAKNEVEVKAMSINIINALNEYLEFAKLSNVDSMDY